MFPTHVRSLLQMTQDPKGQLLQRTGCHVFLLNLDVGCLFFFMFRNVRYHWIDSHNQMKDRHWSCLSKNKSSTNSSYALERVGNVDWPQNDQHVFECHPKELLTPHLGNVGKCIPRKLHTQHVQIQRCQWTCLSRKCCNRPRNCTGRAKGNLSQEANHGP